MSSTVDVLKVVQAFDQEDNYTVWSDLSINLSTLSTLLQYSQYHKLFQAFIIKLFHPVAARLGWTPKDNEGSYKHLFFLDYLIALQR